MCKFKLNNSILELSIHSLKWEDGTMKSTERLLELNSIFSNEGHMHKSPGILELNEVGIDKIFGAFYCKSTSMCKLIQRRN